MSPVGRWRTRRTLITVAAFGVKPDAAACDSYGSLLPEGDMGADLTIPCRPHRQHRIRRCVSWQSFSSKRAVARDTTSLTPPPAANRHQLLWSAGWLARGRLNLGGTWGSRR